MDQIKFLPLTEAEVVWTITVEGCEEPIEEHFDDADDIRRIHELDRTSEWAWCNVTVEGVWGPWTAKTTLWCCSYTSREDFESNGEFGDMKDEVVNALNQQALQTWKLLSARVA